MNILFRKLNLFLIGFICLTLFAAPLSSYAATFTPIPTNADSHDANPGDGNCADTGNSCSLRAAVEEANAMPGADTIMLSPGIYTLTLGGQLYIDSELTVNGAGTATTLVEAATSRNTATNRVLEISTAGNVTLTSLTVRHGVCNGSCSTVTIYGGGIFNTGTLLLDGVLISDNIATTYGSVGGGIYNSGTLTIRNGSVIGGAGHGNVGSGGGGGIYNTGTLTLDASAISANITGNPNSGGGGILNDGGTVFIRNGSVVGGSGAGNSAPNIAAGGGIANDRGGNTTIDASTVSHNSADYLGGGISNGTGTLIVRNGSVIGPGNSAYDGGGIINYGTATIDASTVTGNSSSGNDNPGVGGGGIFNVYILNIQNGSVIGGIDGGNSAANYGGGIFNWAGSTVNISNSRILYNTAINGGGGIHNQSSGIVNVTGSCVVGNNNTAFNNLSAAVQMASGNWWGAFDGPSGAGPGHGDTVSTNVDYSSFLTTAPAGCDTIYDPPNSPPTLNSDQSAISVFEGQIATNSGTVSDSNGDPVSLSASLGTVADNGNGTWSWSYSAPNSPVQNYPITITGYDGIATGQTTFTLTILDAPTVNDFVVLGKDGVWLKQGADVYSGDVGANNTASGPYLDSGVEVSIGQGVHITDPQSAVFGDSVWLKSGSQVAALYYNDKDGNGSVTYQFTPITLPLIPAFPTVPSFTAGTTDVTIPVNGSQTITAGSYRNLLVNHDATLTFTGGVYTFNSWDIRDDAKIYFAATTEIRIVNKLDTNTRVKVMPAAGSGIDASDIKIIVTGINGNNGNIGATPKAAQFGQQNTIHANVYAPNGTLFLRENTIATGAFLGKWVVIGEGVQLIHDTAY